MEICGDHVIIVDDTGSEEKELIENLKFEQAFELKLVQKYFHYLQPEFPIVDIRDDTVLPMKKTTPTFIFSQQQKVFKTRADLILNGRGYKTVENINEGLKTIKVAFCRRRNREVIVKIMPMHITKLLDNNIVKEMSIAEILFREINSLKNIKHENILGIYGYFKAERKLFLIVEYGPYGTLFDMIRRFSYFEENVVREIFKGLLAAVYYCHEKEICIRNITCDNIYLFDNLQVKLSIAHMNKYFSNFYRPPTAWKVQASLCSNIICSTGLVLHYMLVGYFPDRSKCNWKSSHLDLEPGFPTLTAAAVNILHRMLGSHRTTTSIDDLVDDPWITAKTHYLKETALQYEHQVRTAEMECQVSQDTTKIEDSLLAKPILLSREIRRLADEHRQLVKGLIHKIKAEKVYVGEDSSI